MQRKLNPSSLSIFAWPFASVQQRSEQRILCNHTHTHTHIHTFPNVSSHIYVYIFLYIMSSNVTLLQSGAPANHVSPVARQNRRHRKPSRSEYSPVPDVSRTANRPRPAGGEARRNYPNFTCASPLLLLSRMGITRWNWTPRPIGRFGRWRSVCNSQ